MRPGQHMLKGCLSKNESRTIDKRRPRTISKKMRRRYNKAAKKHKSEDKTLGMVSMRQVLFKVVLHQ